MSHAASTMEPFQQYFVSVFIPKAQFVIEAKYRLNHFRLTLNHVITFYAGAC